MFKTAFTSPPTARPTHALVLVLHFLGLFGLCGILLCEDIGYIFDEPWVLIVDSSRYWQVCPLHILAEMEHFKAGMQLTFDGSASQVCLNLFL